jgi:hypothetical protein
MTFPVDMWVAVAAASPIISLSGVVAFTDTARRALAADKSPEVSPRRRKVIKRFSIISYILNYLGAILPAPALIYSLFSLKQESNALSPNLAISLVIWGFDFILIAGILQGSQLLMLPDEMESKANPEDSNSD